MTDPGCNAIKLSSGFVPVNAHALINILNLIYITVFAWTPPDIYKNVWILTRTHISKENVSQGCGLEKM